jgi:hypothetical protein
MGFYTAYILIQNFESESKKLVFDDKLSIVKIDIRNFDELKAIFKSVNRFGQHFIERRYDEVPSLPEGEEDYSGLGRIPEDSEDLMLLLRLFKTGDLAFVEQDIKQPQGNSLRQYEYPMVFSKFHSPHHYRMSEEEIPRFKAFYKEAPKWPGWGSEWFKIARRYFLWGGSKEFHPGRDNERILDYMIALEASFVPEGDFISRRLRERAVAILGGAEDEKASFRKMLNEFYGIRSALAHGNALSPEQTMILEKKRLDFEDGVRRLMRKVLENCPASEDERRRYLSGLYDISDVERAEKIISDYGAIEDVKIKDELLKRLTISTTRSLSKSDQ